jgi:hypothetical protein
MRVSIAGISIPGHCQGQETRDSSKKRLFIEGILVGGWDTEARANEVDYPLPKSNAVSDESKGAMGEGPTTNRVIDSCASSG